MHTGLKSEFSQQSLISKCLLNSVILWNEIMLFGVKANWISHDALPGRKLCQGTDGAKRSVNNLPSPLKLELYWGVVIVYLLCICLSVHCLLWKALLSVECCRQTLEVWFCRVSGKKRLRDHKKKNTFILKLDTKAVPDGTQWVGHTLRLCPGVDQVRPALSEVAVWRL